MRVASPDTMTRPASATRRTSGAFQRLLDGTNTKVVCCLPGTSQYTQGAGGSSCGLACLNAIRVVYGLPGTGGVQLLEQMNRPDTIRACLAICASWSGEAHLEVDDIRKLPLFETSLALGWTNYGVPKGDIFEKMLRKMAIEVNDQPCIAVVLTRPPEMTAVFCVPVAGEEGEKSQCLYAVFDSHPRPAFHPDGAAFIFFRDAAETAAYLADLLRVDASLFHSGALQWQAQLLAQFSAHCFAPKKSAGLDLVRQAYDANMALMDLRLRLSDVDAEMRKILKENDSMKRQLEREREKVRNLEAKERSRAMVDRDRDRDRDRERAAFPAPARRELVLQPAVPSPSKAPFPVWGNPGGSRQASTVARPVWNPPAPPLSPTATSSGANRPSLSDLPNPAWSTATTSAGTHKSRVTVPLPGPPSPKQSLAEQRSKPARAVTRQRERDREREDDSRESDYARAVRLEAQRRAADYDLAARLQAEEQEAFLTAQRQQAALDAEDARLRAERDALAETMAQKTFDCAVCMESWAEDGIARVDGCGHALCRPCMRLYIQSALRDRSFPIVCPVCKADKRKEGEDYTISPHIVETIGLDEAEFAIWNGLQIVGFSVEVECRKCKSKVPVDREDYDLSPWIKCPMPGCKYIWCKKCNQEIPLGPVDHSCDGTKELDHLMKQTGWKYCPGCSTPCEKTDGCNHMTCKTPGCNAHFCYRCGELIVKSSTGPVINTHLGLHYARCTLFDNVPA